MHIYIYTTVPQNISLYLYIDRTSIFGESNRLEKHTHRAVQATKISPIHGRPGNQNAIPFPVFWDHAYINIYIYKHLCIYAHTYIMIIHTYSCKYSVYTYIHKYQPPKIYTSDPNDYASVSP